MEEPKKEDLRPDMEKLIEIMGQNNKNLHAAKKAKNDEFYTLYETVEKEIPFYKDKLKGKIIYCPCDDYRESNFVKYLKDKFLELGLKELISTNYDNGNGAWKYTYDGTNEAVEELQGDGNYNSQECSGLRDYSDVIITNPPFSVFRDFYAWIGDKKFLVICPLTNFVMKICFEDLYKKKIWPGCSMRGATCLFRHPNGNREINGIKYAALNNASWMTNLIPQGYTPPKLVLNEKTYSPSEYPKYDNYDAIEVSKVKDIPKDYEGVMGVPITILRFYDPYTHGIGVEYEILGQTGNKDWAENECDFYEKPNEEEIKNLKKKDKNFREQDAYKTDDSNNPKKYFSRFFIRGAASRAMSKDTTGGAFDGYGVRGYLNGQSTFARLMIEEKKKILT